MDITNPGLLKYSEAHTSPESPVLEMINRDTNANVLMPRMLSGHLQGRLLAMISRLLKPHRILEIGTYTGYSAICLAEGLQQGGKIITIDNNHELETRTRRNFRDAGIADKVDFRIGKAIDVIPRLEENFDLVFIDADKENYNTYFDLVFTRVKRGGFLLADNVLWSGKVIEPGPDRDTQAIMQFNEKIQNDMRVENVLLPIRDGVMIIRKL